jgi:hypothetical protein
MNFICFVNVSNNNANNNALPQDVGRGMPD